MYFLYFKLRWSDGRSINTGTIADNIVLPKTLGFQVFMSGRIAKGLKWPLIDATSHMPQCGDCSRPTSSSHSLQRLLLSDHDRLATACTTTTGFEPSHHCRTLELPSLLPQCLGFLISSYSLAHAACYGRNPLISKLFSMHSMCETSLRLRHNGGWYVIWS